MSSWAVYCEPMGRANPKVTAADIELAISRYQEVNGSAPKFVGLHPKNAGLPIPEGMELRIIGGCLVFEVWLADSDPQPARQGISTTSERPTIAYCAATPGDPIDFIAPDPVTVKIRALAGQGNSTRAIAKMLQTEGITMSHMTVCRRLQGKLI